MFNYGDGRVYYEKHETNSSNIILIRYNGYTNSFEDTVELTSGSAMSINPYEDFSLNVVYQTNENGNWDIAYKEFENGVFGPMILTLSRKTMKSRARKYAMDRIRVIKIPRYTLLPVFSVKRSLKTIFQATMTDQRRKTRANPAKTKRMYRRS